MKKLTYIFAPVLAILILGSCQKESSVTEDPQTSYYYSMKGEQRTAIQGEVYQVVESEHGTCEGYFFKPTSEYFDFIVELSDGFDVTTMSPEEMEEKQFELDFEFTGIAYNCTRSYKGIHDQPKGHPVEIQQVKVSRIVAMD